MQKIDLICIGKLNASYFAAGVAEYQKRLGAFCEFRIIELPEEAISEKNASQAVIESKIPQGATVIALCVEGKLISSEELAAAIADRAMSGAGDMTFVIGSSHGLAPMVKQAAAMKISLGRITLPHQLARLVLTEQLYRAFAINNHIKYHK